MEKRVILLGGLLSLLFSFNIFVQGKPNFKDALGDASLSNYHEGLKCAWEGRLFEAERLFERSLEINEFARESQQALEIIKRLKEKTIDPLVVQAFFGNLFLKIQLEEIQTQIEEVRKSSDAFKSQLDYSSKEIENLKANYEATIFNLQNKIEKMEADIDYLENRLGR